MTQADTQTWFNKLAGTRNAQPVTPGVGFTVKQCDGFIAADAIYTYRCPGAWLEYAGVPSAQTAQLVFPRNYFNWVKLYLQATLPMRPSSSASPEFRVLWALDTWVHVNYALFALPFPWSDIYSGGVSGVDELVLRAVAFGTNPTSLSSTGAEVSAWSREKARIAGTSTTKSIRDAVAASRLNPSPFSELATQWCAAPGSRSPRFQHPNPIWPLLLAAVQPWSSTWMDHWLLSRGNKDSREVAQAQNDPAMLRAVLQWRLWSVQDWGSVSPDVTYWPQGMGRATDVATLSSYINHVAHDELPTPQIDFHGAQAYPNLAFGLDTVAEQAARIARINFDEVLQLHLDMWASQSAPRLNADGSLVLRPDGSVTRQPMTAADYRDYFKGLRKAVTDRTRMALANPALNCSPGDVQCLKAAEYGAKFQAAVQSSPLAPIQNNLQRVADKITAVLGAAIGGGYEPIFVLRHPFSRMFSAAGYRLAADGSTADVFYRIAVAVEHYKQLIPGIFKLSVARVARYQAKIYWTRAGDPCEIRADRPYPPCAANVPNLPPPPNDSAAALSAACDGLWRQLLSAADPTIKLCIDAPVHKQVFDGICASLASGILDLQTATLQWSNYVARVCTTAPRPRSIFAALREGFLHVSNPFS